MRASELCREMQSMARGWESGNEIVGARGERIVFMVGEKAMNPRCSLQLASEAKLYRKSTKQESDEFLK